MSDLGCTVERFTVAAVVLRQCGPRPSDGWSALARTEKIMTKTTRTTEVRELSLEELASVSGGEALVHERLHVANKTECCIFDVAGMDLFMQCFR
jgi:hypothetical protein